MKDQKPPKDLEWTLEIVPRHLEESRCLQGLVGEIFVTMIPGCDPMEVAMCLGGLQGFGFSPVPHLASRAFPNEEVLSTFFQTLRENGIGKALILAGGGSQPKGPFKDSWSVMQSSAFRDSGLKSVALAGHPEGNPADPDAFENLIRKIERLREMNIRPEIVTQWSFSPDAVNRYIDSLRQLGFENPIRIGVPGPANLKTLLKYAKVCGVVAAREVLKKQGFSLGRLLMRHDPGSFVKGVYGTKSFHLYPFGGLERSARWLRESSLPA